MEGFVGCCNGEVVVLLFLCSFLVGFAAAAHAVLLLLWCSVVGVLVSAVLVPVGVLVGWLVVQVARLV